MFGKNKAVPEIGVYGDFFDIKRIIIIQGVDSFTKYIHKQSRLVIEISGSST
jgi:hypothetical protein